MNKCFYCEQMAETRPYGPNYEPVCCPCAMTPERIVITSKQFKTLYANAMKQSIDGIVYIGSELGPLPNKSIVQ